MNKGSVFPRKFQIVPLGLPFVVKIRPFIRLIPPFVVKIRPFIRLIPPFVARRFAIRIFLLKFV